MKFKSYSKEQKYLKLNIKDYLVERKDHIIKKIPNLTDDQKKELISFFKRKSNLENKIDWNKWKTLTYDDFKGVIGDTKTEKKKKVKKSGVKGLKKNKDYVDFPLNKSDIQAYIPLTWEASKLIASKYVGGTEGKWCTAYQKDKQHWTNYVLKNKVVLIYLIYSKTKYAIAIYDGNSKYEVFDEKDTKISSLPSIDIKKDILSKSSLLNKIRKHIEDSISPMEKYNIKNYTVNADGTIDVKGDVDLTGKGLKKIPIKFGKVAGTFDCSYNNLTSLEGAPKEVGGDFYCYNNKLTSLEGAPKEVGGNFDCSSNNLTSLEGAPKEVGGDFICRKNKVVFSVKDVTNISKVKGKIY